MTSGSEIIIVGSGPAGVSAAWPLVRAGLRVRMLDASSASARAISRASTLGTRPNRAESSYADEDLSPKFSLPNVKAALQDYVRRHAIERHKFFVAGSLARGGLSTVWGALAEAFEEDEFAAFPFGPEALQQSYADVASRIGVSGGRLAGAGAISSAPARDILRRHFAQPRDPAFDLYPARNAILQETRGLRQPCNRCGECLFGCSRGSIYDSSLELPSLQRHQNFSYEPGNFVHSLHSEGEDHIVSASAEGASRGFRAPILVLAAGTIATTALVMRRLDFWERATPMLSNPSGASAYLAPSYIGRELPEQSVSLGQLFYRIRTRRSRAAGVLYGADSLPLHFLAERIPTSRPVALNIARALAPALLLATTYLPGSFSRNRLTIHKGEGVGRISIEGERTAEADAALRAAQKELRRRLFRLRAFPAPGSTKILQPGADAHYAGTLPMGGSGSLSASEFGEIRDLRGVFAVDGSVLASLPATHPTLTIMANADRIAREIARRG